MRAAVVRAPGRRPALLCVPSCLVLLQAWGLFPRVGGRVGVEDRDERLGSLDGWLHRLRAVLASCGTRGGGGAVEAPLVTWCLPLRLHEFDEQVAAVREGMARVVPVPLLSLFTGYELETMVGGSAAAPLAGPFRGDPLRALTASVHCALGGLGCSA